MSTARDSDAASTWRRVSVADCSAVDALQASLPIARDRLGTTSYLQIQVMQGDTPFGIRHYWKSHFVDDLSDDLIDDIVDHHQNRSPGSISSILIEPVHGQATRIPLDATAFGRRSTGFNVSVLGHWRDPGADDTEIAWVRAGAQRSAARAGNPTKAVMEFYDVKRSTASRWIKKARDTGLLGAAVPGKAGEVEGESQ